jgi:geranylgeranyl diphosphate synthase type II
MQVIQPFLQVFLSYLDEYPLMREPRELYEPVQYILRLGGKRLRPVGLLMATSVFDKSYERALPAAMALETFHNFTLMHDDIMDDAPLRRGKPTVHLKYDLNTGILSGDAMLILAYQMLMEVQPKELVTELLALFNKTAIEVCEGQQMDINFESRQDVLIEEYLRMIELKTAVLFACALQMGARIGGASIEDAAHLYDFGRNIGIAFQLQDDLLDTFGDPGKVGKKTGGDIAQNKKTYLYLKALEVAGPAEKEELSRLFSERPVDEGAKINRVIQLFQQLGIQEAAESIKNKYRNKAYQALERVSVTSPKLEMFRTLGDFLLGRDQ